MSFASISTKFRAILGDQLAAKLLGPGLLALIIKIASAALSYLMLVAFARLLDAEDYGYFGVMMNISIVLSTIVAFGLPVAVMRFWPGHIARREFGLALGFHVAAQRALLAVGTATLALGCVVAWAGWWESLLGSPVAALLVAALSVSFAFGDYYANALRAQSHVLWSMLPRDVFWRVVSPMAAAILLYASGRLTASQAILCCLAVMVAIAVIQAVVAAAISTAQTENATPESCWRMWSRPLLPLAGASILYAMVQQLDVIVIGSLLGAQEAGAYFAAQKTASLLGLVMIAGGLVAAPLMSAAYQDKRKHELQRLCQMLAFAIAIATASGFVLLVVLGEPLLSIFDPSYASAYSLLLVLAFGYAIDACAGPTAYLMQMTSLENTYLRIMAVVYAVVLALQIVFVPLYGALAAACASALGVALWNVFAIYVLRRDIGIDSSILSFFVPPKKS